MKRLPPRLARPASAGEGAAPGSQRERAQDAAGVGADGAATEQLDTVVIRPKKADIDVTLLTLAFAPHWQGADGQLTPAFQPDPLTHDPAGNSVFPRRIV